MADQSDLIRFIRDEPAEQDFFQTHTRLAEALAASIRNNPGLRVIGLLGRWGSGKSTVIRQLHNALGTPQQEVHLFTYDAWLHQSDPVRRSFLESLLRYLIDHGLTQEEQWKDRLKALTGRIEDTDVLETPSLAPAAKAMLFSIIPVPLGAALIDLDTIKDAFGSDTTKAGVLTFWIAFVLVLFPLWTGIGLYFKSRPWGTNVLRREFWRLGKPGSDTSLILPLFLNQTIKRQAARTIISSDPSSIEFGSTFREIMKAVSKPGRRFVFIIDNLDRVAETEALQLWATIRSFFLASDATESISHETYHPVVILPVDDHAIERMFALTSEPQAARDLARSFINKTFDISFEVTEPVMSDWRAFLYHQLRKAFGDEIDPSWLFWARMTFEKTLIGRANPVTPREINKLVNNIAVRFLQWKGEGISFHVVAFYVIHRDDIGTNLLDFVQQRRGALAEVVDDWERQLAAIHYGVPVDKAAQVLIEEPLREAVTNFDQEAFAELSTIHGFNETFESLVSELPRDAGSSAPSFMVVTNAALLLSSLEASQDHWYHRAWNKVIAWYELVDGFGPVPGDLDLRIGSLLSHINGDSEPFITRTIDRLSRVISESDLTYGTMENLAKTADVVLSAAVRAGITKPEIVIQAPAQRVLARIPPLMRREAVRSQVRVETSPSELVEYLVGMFGEATTAAKVPALVGLLSESTSDELFEAGEALDWGTVIDRSADIVRNSSSPVEIVPHGILTLAKLIRTQKGARDALVELVDQGILTNRLNEFYQINNLDALIDVAAILIWRGGNFSSPSGTTWLDIIQKKRNLPELVHSSLRRFFGNQTISVLWNSFERATASRTLLENIIIRMIESEDLGLVPLKDVFFDLDKYLRPIPWRLRAKFLSTLERYNTFWDRLEQAPINDQLQEASRLVAKNGDEQSRRIRLILRDRMDKISPEEWAGAVASGAQPFGILMEFLPPAEYRVNHRSSLFQGLTASAADIARGSDRPRRKRWFALLAHLTPKAEKQAVGDLAGKILGAGSVNGTPSLFKDHGAVLLKSSTFLEKPDEFVLDIVMPQARSRPGRSWLKSLGNDVRAIINKSSPQTKRKLRDLITKFEKNGADERRYWAEVIRKAWFR